jgi:hypothetical protein
VDRLSIVEKIDIPQTQRLWELSEKYQASHGGVVCSEHEMESMRHGKFGRELLGCRRAGTLDVEAEFEYHMTEV